MALIQYPVFVKGQTLTNDDLNELRDFLDGEDRKLGRLIGFGINCGLGGAIKDKVLSIEPGLAIDQLGESIVLDDVYRTELPPRAPTERGPDFLDTSQVGFTPVLTVTTVELPAVRCTEAGCEGHAKQREVRTSITLFPGRLSAKVVDFGDETLLAFEPLLVRKTSTVDGPFEKLKAAIIGRLGGRLDTDAVNKLTSIKILTSDLPAIQGYKAGFLNQVFFAALDLLRCELLTGGGCGSMSGSVGVALGWAYPNGADWTWDCTFRHDWRVPTGVTLALVGGRCVDPCDVYRDQMNAMINAFEIPVVPAKEDPPKTQEPDICKISRVKTTKQDLVSGTVCGRIKLPPNRLREKWPPPWWTEPEIFHLIDPLDLTDADHVYGRPDDDPMDLGGLDLLGAVGHHSDDVVKALVDLTKDPGVSGDVHVIGADGIKDIAGYEATLTPSLADTIYLTEDSQHKVIGVGVVPAANVMRNTATELPIAAEAARAAEVAATNALDLAGTLNERVETFDQQFEGFEAFQKETINWQTTMATKIGGLSGEIDTKVGAAVNEFQVRVGGELEQRIDLAVNTLRTGLLEQVKAEIGSAGGEIRTDLTHDLNVATDAVRAEAKADQGTLSAQVLEIGKEVGVLSGQMESAVKEAERGNVRIDSFLSIAATPGRVTALTPEFGTDMVAVMGTMRESITAAATPAQREKVRAALAESDAAFTRLQAASAAGTLDLVAEKEAFGTVLESMTTAVEAAGAPAATVNRLRRDSAGVLDRMR